MAGGGKVRRWLAPMVGAVLLLAGGIGWWTAPTDGAMTVEAGAVSPAPARASVREEAGKATALAAREPPAPVVPAPQGSAPADSARAVSVPAVSAPLAPVAASAALPGGEIPGTVRHPARLDAWSASRSPGRGRAELTEAEREARRFSRVDRDRNGTVSREEFLASRRKSFARLDRNGDGLLTFEEYAASTAARFDAADRNGDGLLSRSEFAATAPRRSAEPGRRTSAGS